MNPVTLQINLAPRDFRFAQYLLPHQLRQLRGQVAEVLLVIESRQSRGRYGEDWEVGLKAIHALAHALPGGRVISVDYSATAQRKVCRQFFGRRHRLPAKDRWGGPYFGYFYGLSQATHDLVMHLDADMFFGGGSQTWMAEATELLMASPDVLVINPYGTPPPSSGVLEESHDPGIRGARATPRGVKALVFDHMSTRNFLISRKKFADLLGPLSVVDEQPKRRRGLKIFELWRQETAVQMSEITISNAMKARGLVRLDYLGEPPGMWSFHPPQVPFPGYYEQLPRLVARVETGDIPEAQRGYIDMNESMRM